MRDRFDYSLSFLFFLVPEQCAFNNGNEVLTALNVPEGISIGLWCLYTIIVFLVFHVVGLLAVSFMYNSRIENWLKKKQEQKREKENVQVEPHHIVGGINEEIFDNQAYEIKTE